jgi:uncharacterized protein (DUF1810 family)
VLLDWAPSGADTTASTPPTRLATTVPNLRWVVGDTASSIDMVTTADNLQRFVDAQREVYDNVRTELRAGCKRSHWMWFVFPQLAGLGSSPTARYYALAGLAEARAFLAHPLLGERLRECTQLVNAAQERSVHAIFGSPDNLKFRSCMTLFAAAAGEAPDAGREFREALTRYFDGAADPRTLALLKESSA